MRVAVIGAAGFIGANLVRSLSTAGHDVHGVVSAVSDSWRLDGIGSKVHAVRSDGGHPGLLRVLDRVRPDIVVNTAAHGAYPDQRSIERMCDTNIVLVEALAEWCTVQHAALLHLGSSSEYGESDQPPSEHGLLRPNSTYAATKAAGTHLVCDAVRRRQLVGVVFRLYSVYGPWEAPSRLMPTIAVNALAGRLPPRLVSPAIARDFIHIDDVSAAVMSWIEQPRAVGDPSVLNIGSGTQTSLGELIDIVQILIGADEQPNWGSMEDRRWDTTRWQADPSAAAQALGWTARVSLDAGLRNLIAFAAAHPSRYRSGG